MNPQTRGQDRSVQYPKEFKARVALEALKEVKTIAELSSEHESTVP